MLTINTLTAEPMAVADDGTRYSLYREYGYAAESWNDLTDEQRRRQYEFCIRWFNVDTAADALGDEQFAMYDRITSSQPGVWSDPDSRWDELRDAELAIYMVTANIAPGYDSPVLR